ncbi:MAG: ornithine carbamoyltransferase [Alphaproteobacteria bacterium]|jgi:ornithine carbamoyltransferase|tara:strand:+ start:877 stop:1767 length:891 start_codon:yes stop_codon:yes gene_type:complete
MKHFLNIDEISSKEILKIIKTSHKLKKNYGKIYLKKKKILGMIFEKPSTRTRVSFEVGIKQMGGDVVVLDQNDSQLGRGESLNDTVKVLSSYVDVIMYRGKEEKNLYEISKVSSVPIINGLTDKSHPCQILADIMTLEEKFPNVNKLNLCWVGDGNNVCNSWIHLTKHYNFNLAISCPEGCFPDQRILKQFSNDNLKVFSNPNEAVEGADVVITDTWVSMGMDQNLNRLKKFKKFQLNSKLVNKTKKKSFILHCLPAHRGEEITNEIIDGKNSLVWDEAENRLYTHQSILLWCLGF